MFSHPLSCVGTHFHSAEAHTHIFTVRDLPGHFQVAWQAVPGEQADQERRILTQPFDEIRRPSCGIHKHASQALVRSRLTGPLPPGKLGR
ncbi:MAG: hypothetical protein JJ992_15635 [Planctomycetes bacterium]|nr:hypothetical protein [Planctomycetota bacterium]